MDDIIKFPKDIWTYFVSYFNGYEITKLWFCGNKALNYILSSVVHEFKVDNYKFNKV